jgi:hypothetical protein
MLLPLLVVVMIALAFLLRARAGRESPDRVERLYLAAAALPLVLVIAVPAVVGLTLGFDGHTRRLIDRANLTGIGLSVALVLAGGALIVRARRQRRGWGWPLGGALLVAAAPVVIVALTYALFTLAAVLLP